MAISDRIAVMRGGLIEQLGTAEDLYRRPRSAFVARFIGRANIVHGVARETIDGHVTVDLAGQSIGGKARGPIANGAKVSVVVRPESISIAAFGDGIRATVTGRVYLGDKVEYTVRLGDETLQIVRSDPPETEDISPGQEVSMRLPGDGVEVLTDE